MKTALSIKVGIGKAAHNQGLEKLLCNKPVLSSFLSPLTSHFSALSEITFI